MYVAALRAGAVTRETLRAAVDDLGMFDGLAGRYRFGEGGGLVAGPKDVHVYVVEGGRWLQGTDGA
jgi:hypothetical protein